MGPAGCRLVDGCGKQTPWCRRGQTVEGSGSEGWVMCRSGHRLLLYLFVLSYLSTNYVCATIQWTHARRLALFQNCYCIRKSEISDMFTRMKSARVRKKHTCIRNLVFIFRPCLKHKPASQ